MTARPASAIALYVIEDHPVVREGLRMLLGATAGLSVAGAAPSASAALPDLRGAPPDVVLLDLDLGGEDGLEWLPRIQEAAPNAAVLVLTALRDPGREKAALRAGARGFVQKDAPAEVVLEAVRAVASGAPWFSAAAGIAPGRAAPPRGPPALAALTDRERDLVRLVSEGLRNEEIAHRLGITEKTVRNNLTALFEKMGVSGRLELVVLAYRHGLARVRR